MPTSRWLLGPSIPLRTGTGLRWGREGLAVLPRALEKQHSGAAGLCRERAREPDRPGAQRASQTGGIRAETWEICRKRKQCEGCKAGVERLETGGSPRVGEGRWRREEGGGKRGERGRRTEEREPEMRLHCSGLGPEGCELFGSPPGRDGAELAAVSLRGQAGSCCAVQWWGQARAQAVLGLNAV